jgi:hypothetical protein
MKSLAVSLLLSAALLIGAPPAAAADTDAAAIASFLSIGLANAPTNFSAIRGDLVVQGEYLTTSWPDRTHFVKCRAWHISGNPTANVRENYTYSCNSTLRADTREALFQLAEAAIVANIPSGYVTKGAAPRASDGAPYELWRRPGSADVKLWAFTKEGQAYYELAVVVSVQP